MVVDGLEDLAEAVDSLAAASLTFKKRFYHLQEVPSDFHLMLFFLCFFSIFLLEQVFLLCVFDENLEGGQELL